MAADYIPSADADFDVWQRNFYSYINSHLDELGITQGEMVPLINTQESWQAEYNGHITAQAAASGARQAKDTAREHLEAITRQFVRRVQTLRAVTDSVRAQLRITIPSERTSSTPPQTRPVASIDTGQRLRHTINFVDETTPASRARPDGATGCEIWVKVGEAPAGPSEVTYLGTDTRTPYMIEYDEADAGKKAHYMLRWINSKGETGPWSQTVNATITA